MGGGGINSFDSSLLFHFIVIHIVNFFILLHLL
jgi:hypothetical protein